MWVSLRYRWQAGKENRVHTKKSFVRLYSSSKNANIYIYILKVYSITNCKRYFYLLEYVTFSNTFQKYSLRDRHIAIRIMAYTYSPHTRRGVQVVRCTKKRAFYETRNKFTWKLSAIQIYSRTNTRCVFKPYLRDHWSVSDSGVHDAYVLTLVRPISSKLLEGFGTSAVI